MMDSGKWTITLLLLMSVGFTASQMDDDVPITDINVGADLDLECHNRSDPSRPFWRKGHEILRLLSETLIRDPVNRSITIRRLVVVTFDDEGDYITCTVHTEPQNTSMAHLQVKETPCEAPLKPVNGYYRSDTHTYKTGDTIRYHCDRGYQLIGQSHRNCTGTHTGWQPAEEPYCQPEYIGHLMQRLNGIEAEMKVIKQSIVTIENHTLNMGYNGAVMDNKVTAINSKVSSTANIVSAIYNMELFTWQKADNRERLTVCTDTSKAIDEDTVSKCMTMQLGERNGHNVSVFKWIIEDYKSKVTSSRWAPYNSTIFYYTVPGYKLKLRGFIDNNTDIVTYPSIEPGDYDDQSTLLFSKHHDVIVLTNDGTEILQKTFSGDHSTCRLNQITRDNERNCYTYDPKWGDVYANKKHILSDGSVVIKLYIHN